MSIDRFVGSVGNAARVRIVDAFQKHAALSLQGIDRELVFAVEVRSDDQMPVFLELRHGLIENLVPGGVTVPVVLMTQKRDVHPLKFADLVEFRAVVNEEFGVDVFAESVVPARVGFGDFAIANVGADDLAALMVANENVRQRSCFVGATASERENIDVIFGIESFQMRGFQARQQLLQALDVLCGFFVRKWKRFGHGADARKKCRA